MLAFFGISLAALRVAGGLVVALSGWDLLNAPEQREDAEAGAGRPAARFGRYRVVSADHPDHHRARARCRSRSRWGPAARATFARLAWFFVGMTAAAMAMALVIWVTYRYADRMTA